jgi:hypothetical protein
MLDGIRVAKTISLLLVIVFLFRVLRLSGLEKSVLGLCSGAGLFSDSKGADQ